MKRITRRDEVIVGMLKELGFATRDQIKRGVFRCQLPWHRYWCDCTRRGNTAVNRRLRRLVEFGKIQALIVPRYEQISQGKIYVPTKNGLNRKLEDIRFSQHGLMINDILLWLVLSWPEGFMLEFIPQERGSRIADAAVELQSSETGARLRLYIEADRGTESRPQLEVKFGAYRQDSLFKPEDLILFVTTRTNLQVPLTASWNAGLHDGILFCNFCENRSFNAFLDAMWALPYGQSETTVMEYFLSRQS